MNFNPSENPLAHWDADPSDDGPEPTPTEVQALASGQRTTLTAPSAPTAGPGDEQLAAWIEAVGQQDERALAVLYDATVSRVYSVALRVVRRAALAEEVVEDTYFQVWRQALRFDPLRGKALTWLLGMARSRAIDMVRREARFALPSLDADGALDGFPAIHAVHAVHSANEHTPQDELLDLAQAHSELHRALLLLGAQPRQLVALAFFKGLTHEEISSQTQLPLGTVKSQIRRALATLHQLLVAHPEGPAMALNPATP
jgi:RNA polymerase sigma factor (sigma-70 family)